MTTVRTTHRLTEKTLAAITTPRQDLLQETATSQTSWRQEVGPFASYERTVQIDEEHQSIEETIRYTLAVHLWQPYFWLQMRRALQTLDRQPRQRWWWPKEIVDTQTTRLISLLAIVAFISGYLGVVIGQTIAFAGKDLGISEQEQPTLLAWLRVGIILSIVVMPKADKIGRRPLILFLAFTSIAFTIVSGFATSTLFLAVSQATARALVTALFTLVTVATLEQVPARWRTSAVTTMALSAGLGASLIVAILPFADDSADAWRLPFFLPLLFIPLLWPVVKHLPETKRFVSLEKQKPSGEDATFNKKWFVAVAMTAFLLPFFFTPVSQLRNTFLDEQKYSAGDITLFNIAISLPATIAVIIAASIADRKTRRKLALLTIVLGAGFSALSYQNAGTILWLFAGVGVLFTSAAFPTLQGYKSELFPTKVRSRLGGYLDVISVAGSGLGLLTVSYLQNWFSLQTAISLLVAAPAIGAVVIFASFPETTHKELEELTKEWSPGRESNS